jgi:hypothetical protein
MFGVNTTIMNEGGIAVPFYATLAYRDALYYLEMIGALGVLGLVDGSEFQAFAFPPAQVGWEASWPNFVSISISGLRQNPGARLLFTPPEVGPGGSGVGTRTASHFSNSAFNWVIGPHVTDEVLARLLIMFDAMSFEPEAAVITNIGFWHDEIRSEVPPENRTAMVNSRVREGYAWEGERFNSVLVEMRSPNYEWGEAIFATNIIDGNAMKQAYYSDPDVVTAFAASPFGKMLNLHPFKEDPQGLYADELNMLNERYGDVLNGPDGIINSYLWGVLTGEVNVSRTWNDYIARLNAAGLQEFIELYERFPLTNY